jgi:hypothetical protein
MKSWQAEHGIVNVGFDAVLLDHPLYGAKIQCWGTTQQGIEVFLGNLWYEWGLQEWLVPDHILAAGARYESQKEKRVWMTSGSRMRLKQSLAWEWRVYRQLQEWELQHKGIPPEYLTGKAKDTALNLLCTVEGILLSCLLREEQWKFEEKEAWLKAVLSVTQRTAKQVQWHQE